MKKTLIISGHPNLSESLANKIIINKFKKDENITIHDLAEKYPDYKINVEVEQKLLLKHDIIIFQYPFYWYNMTGILKKWFDDVFTYGFAYGSTGDKLKGKHFIVSTTVGGWEHSYTPLSFNHFPMAELLKPLEQTAYLAQMKWEKPIATHSMVYIPGVYHTKNEVTNRALDHANGLLQTIENIRNKKPVVEKFVKNWFAGLDILEEDTFFLPYINDESNFTMGEDNFSGKDGFKAWYSEILKLIKPNNTHNLSNIEIKSKNNIDFDISFEVELIAKTLDDKDFNLKAKENWEISLGENDTPIIKSYTAKSL
ncbi:MAG: NAD(P)H-dependent oxidoreductase [Candidatus Gracilibacteria bacterium]|nr:NAD(P)H-dependent oxidoreductase [Candidatus Gracilibacteria bacterium]